MPSGDRGKETVALVGADHVLVHALPAAAGRDGVAAIENVRVDHQFVLIRSAGGVCRCNEHVVRLPFAGVANGAGEQPSRRVELGARRRVVRHARGRRVRHGIGHGSVSVERLEPEGEGPLVDHLVGQGDEGVRLPREAGAAAVRPACVDREHRGVATRHRKPDRAGVVAGVGRRRGDRKFPLGGKRVSRVGISGIDEPGATVARDEPASRDW